MTEHTLDEDLSKDKPAAPKPKRLFFTAVFQPRQAWPWIIDESKKSGAFILLVLIASLFPISNIFMTIFTYPEGGLGLIRYLVIPHILAISVFVAGQLLYIWLMNRYSNYMLGASHFGQYLRVMAWSGLPLIVLFPVSLGFNLLSYNLWSLTIAHDSFVDTQLPVIEFFRLAFTFFAFLWVLIRSIQGIMAIQKRGIGHAIGTLVVPAILVVILCGSVFLLLDSLR